MAATRRQAATTRKRTPARTPLGSRWRRVGSAVAGSTATAWRTARAGAPAPWLALIVFGLAVVGIITIIAFAAAERTTTVDVTDGAAPEVSVRERNLEAQLVALRAADCGAFSDLADGHASALELPPAERLDQLARLAVVVPAATGGALEPGLAHLRIALEHDAAATAWSLAGEPGRAAAATRLAAGEALQAEAYAAAVCSG